MTEERSERRVVVNDHVDAFAAASGIGPRIDLVEKMIFEVHFLVGTRIEDVSKRAEDAGGKEGNQQNDGAGQSEPAWRQSGEEQHEQFVAGDSKPVDEDIALEQRRSRGEIACAECRRCLPFLLLIVALRIHSDHRAF